MLEQLFHAFLRENPLREPLLALSGGPDSMALYQLLKRAEVPFAVAHVNHNWRKESGKEAEILREMCENDHIKFYVKELHIKGKNIEDRCRRERISFFLERGSQILLGHHADDQAETVLKRVFEGSKLNNLKGLSVKTKFGDAYFYRPLLPISKKEILGWLEKEGISFFEDATNRDPKYLRSRMRQKILPLLSESFGKEVVPSLCRLGKLAQELDEYLQKKVEGLPTKGRIDLSLSPPQSLFEWRNVVSYIFEKEGLDPSSFFLEQVIFHLRKKSAHKHLRIKNRCVKLHKQTIEICETKKKLLLVGNE